MTYYHHDCSDESRDSVELGAQHGRYLRKKYVAQHSAADPGQHAKQRCHHRIESVTESLLCADDSEDSQSCGIEDQHKIAEFVQPLATRKPHEDNQSCNE